MKFSIRDILVITFVVALAVININSHYSLSQLQMQTAELRVQSALKLNEIESRQSSLYHARTETDWLTLIEATSNNGLASFPKFQEKYSAITPRDAKTISIRKVPMIADVKTDGGQDRVRLYIPTNMRLYLNFAVITVRPEQYSQDMPIIRESPFNPTGPFSKQLDEGIHDIEMLNYTTEKKFKAFRLTVDGEVAVETVFEDDHISGWSASSVGGNVQSDWLPEHALPDLWTFRLRWDDPNDRQLEQFGFRIWLSRESGNFAPFPRPSIAVPNDGGSELTDIDIEANHE